MELRGRSSEVQVLGRARGMHDEHVLFDRVPPRARASPLALQRGRDRRPRADAWIQRRASPVAATTPRHSEISGRSPCENPRRAAPGSWRTNASRRERVARLLRRRSPASQPPVQPSQTRASVRQLCGQTNGDRGVGAENRRGRVRFAACRRPRRKGHAATQSSGEKVHSVVSCASMGSKSQRALAHVSRKGRDDDLPGSPAIEHRDREAMKFAVRGLRHDLVDDLELGMRGDPAGNHLAEDLAILRLRRLEDLETPTARP